MKTSDECFQAFLMIKKDLPKFDLSSQTEADTRARLISRILQESLDWPPENINREEHANPGFMDYVLLTQKKAVVIEAKRSGDTFTLPHDISTVQNLTLNGILRTVKNLRKYTDQVSNYCFTNGIEYAVITNGPQWVVFRALRVDGIHILQGRVIVFSGFEDIESRFISFWTLLAKSNVENNSLVRAFQPSEAIFQYKRLNDETHAHKERVSRNSLSIQLEPLIREYMGEIADEQSKEKLRDLFVRNIALTEVLNAVEHRIALNISDPSGPLKHITRVVATKGAEDVKKGLKKDIKKNLALPSRGEVMLLLGRVGCGKTTFVNHFLRIELKDLFESNLLVLFDFRLLEKGRTVHSFFFETLREVLAKNDIFVKNTSKYLHQIYASEIRELSLGPLAILERQNKKRFEEKIADFLVEKYRDAETYFVRALRYLADKQHIRCVFVLDNVDQLDFGQQEEIFTFAHSVSGSTHAFSLLTMWEETFLRSKRGGALATYQTMAYTLPPTSVVDIISRRLEYVIKQLKSGGLAKSLLPDAGTAGNVAEFLTLVRKSILQDKKRVRFFLESIAMGNLRKAMDIFSLFLTSGHTDVGKILSIYRTVDSYTIPLHEFIKSIGLGDSKHYHGELSFVLNLYSISDESRPSHFTKLRLLEYLFFHRNRSAAGYGLGFVRTDIIKREFEKIGTSDVDITESLKLLSSVSLIENDVYDFRVISAAYRVTPAGRYYMRWLAGKFPYLDLVLQDTPIGDATVFKKLEELLGSNEVDSKFKRVHLFLDYLKVEEERELYVVMNTSDSLALRQAFIPRMILEFKEDETYIRRRIKRRRATYKGEATPYIIEAEEIEEATVIIEAEEVEEAPVIIETEKIE